MSKLFPLLAAAVLVSSVSFAIAAETKTISGGAVCAKCALKEKDTCQNAVIVKEGGKDVTYYLEGDKSKKAHGAARYLPGQEGQPDQGHRLRHRRGEGRQEDHDRRDDHEREGLNQQRSAHLRTDPVPGEWPSYAILWGRVGETASRTFRVRDSRNLNLLILGANRRPPPGRPCSGFFSGRGRSFRDRDLVSVATSRQVAFEDYPDGLIEASESWPPLPWLSRRPGNRPELSAHRLALRGTLLVTAAALAVRDPLVVASALKAEGWFARRSASIRLGFCATVPGSASPSPPGVESESNRSGQTPRMIRPRTAAGIISDTLKARLSPPCSSARSGALSSPASPASSSGTRLRICLSRRRRPVACLRIGRGAARGAGVLALQRGSVSSGSSASISS